MLPSISLTVTREWTSSHAFRPRRPKRTPAGELQASAGLAEAEERHRAGHVRCEDVRGDAFSLIAVVRNRLLHLGKRRRQQLIGLIRLLLAVEPVERREAGNRTGENVARNGAHRAAGDYRSGERRVGNEG